MSKYQKLYSNLVGLSILPESSRGDVDLLSALTEVFEVNKGLMPLLISELSEDIWAAGWLIDCEYELWARVLQYREFGNCSPWGLASSEILESKIEILDTAAEISKSWGIWGEDGAERIELKKWESIFLREAPLELRDLTQPICGDLGEMVQSEHGWPRIQRCELFAKHQEAHQYT